jgi:hypothetical protein
MAGNPSTGTFTLVYAKDVTGALTAGVSKSGTITVPGQHATYTWSAVAGQHVAFAVTGANVTDGEAGLYAYNVDGALICDFGFETARSSCNYAPTETGTASIVIEGVGDVTPITGSFTLAYTYDVTGTLTAGHRTPVTIKYQGQHAAFTWSARSGRHATFDITKAAMTGGGGTELYAYNPDGSLGCEVAFQTAPTDCTFTATGTGSASVVVQAVDKYNADTGKFTLIQRNH